jgi:phosphoglycolate phosphatase-like HAD superfamily hydrolase
LRNLLQDLSNCKSVVFDCDGVILQSNKIKTNAFRESLKGDPIVLIDQFIEYHKSNGGISRYVKFEYYYQYIKCEKNYKTLSKKAISRYSEIVVEGLIAADYIPGVINAINYFNDKNIPCFVISGGDQIELNEVFSKRGIDNSFVEILGSPITKKEHAVEMVKIDQIKLPGIFFGDAYLDMEVANFIGLDFIFIHGYSEWANGLNIAIKEDLYFYKDFIEVFSGNV